ncbi:NADPH-dependent FMN reductase [Haliangium sp.]|uniref:NADPH-dependent FMN reductase n=1 Tax=Haliangium sp. TaxID=2663208 RepID=UPI003D0F57FB
MSFRVLLLCGSLQRISANRAALDVARAHMLRHDGVSVHEPDLIGDIPMLNPDRQDDPGAAVLALRDQVARSNGLLIACPEYAGALAGGLKNALDWLVGSGELYSKPAAVLSAGTSGGTYARQQLIQTLTWQGAHVVAQLGIAAPKSKSDSAGRFTDADTISAIEHVAQRLLDTATMSNEQRLAAVEEVTTAAGIEPGHIAPVV